MCLTDEGRSDNTKEVFQRIQVGCGQSDHEQHYTRAEAARSLGLHANLLSRWAKEVQRNDGQAFRGNGKLTAEQEETRKLKAQVKRLEMEKDILKKATVFFAAETK